MSSDKEVTMRKKRKKVVPLSDSEDEKESYIRKVQFKYDDRVHFLPTKHTLNLQFTKKPDTTNGDGSTSTHENGVEVSATNGKAKGTPNAKSAKTSRRSKAAKELAKSGAEVKTIEAEFRFLDSSKDKAYKEPTDTVGTFNRYIDSIREEEELPVEYDMDEEDVMWLDTMNKRRKVERQLEVEPEIFELLMDRFERESLFQQSDSQAPPIDEDAVCCICNDGECQNSNAIIFCDMCNLAVHQECYGVPYVPEGQWLCRRCMQSPSVAVDCVLCPNKGGAFKQTDDNRWAHVTCALWIPEVCFGNTVFLEPIENIRGITPQRWKLLCSICRQKKIGACIQCEHSTCCTAFHVTCASQANLYMRIEAVKKNTSQGPVSTVRKVVYCPIHCPKKKNGSQNGGGIYSSGDEDSKPDNAKMLEARKLLQEKRDFVPIVSVPAIPDGKLSALSLMLPFPRRNDFLVRLYCYWKLKRQTKNGAPLIRLTSNQNQHYKREKTSASPPREASEIREDIAEASAVRFGFETLRNLLEMIKKREKIKQTMIREDKHNTVLRFYSFNQLLMSLLERIIEKDSNRFFHDPVTIEDAPDYFQHVTEPMDFSTMKTKIETFKYKTFDDFRKDLNKIISNCLWYNEESTIFYKAAVKLEPQIDNILKDFNKYSDDFDPETGLLKAVKVEETVQEVESTIDTPTTDDTTNLQANADND